MSEYWNNKEDFDLSSGDDLYYSDEIDSDIEAELYSLIHHDSINNSLLLQDDSDVQKDKSKQLHDYFQSKQDHSKSPQDSSILKENNHCKTPMGNVPENSNSFSSDVPTDTNLYTNFETPKKCISMSKNSLTENRKSAKRKSDEVFEVLESIQKKGNNSKNKINNRINLSKKLKNSSFVQVDTESGTDYSVILTEPDESNIQTNIKLDTIILSSSDSDSDSSFERILSKSWHGKTTGFSDKSFNSNSGDPWYINQEDLYRTKRPGSRYHERAVLTCGICKLRGHSAKFCSVPQNVKCFICGGCHIMSKCREKVCFKCYQWGHDSRKCRFRPFPFCTLCSMEGHNIKFCPDLWRRYHLTTSNGKIIRSKSAVKSLKTPLFCYNCGHGGHYGAECSRPRLDISCCRTWTSVVSYGNPSKIFQNQRNRFEENIPNRQDLSSHIETNPQATPTPKRKKRKKKQSLQTPNTGSTSKAKNDVYFPRTPKTPMNENVKFESSTRKLTPKQIAKLEGKPTRRQLQRWKYKDDKLKVAQQKSQMDLQRRLGIFTATS